MTLKRGRVVVAAALVAIGVTLSAPLALAACECGKDRWPVKTASDADVESVEPNAVTTTIEALGSKPKPANRPQDGRVDGVETTVWAVDGTLVKYKLSKDCDYHLVLEHQGHEMVVELAAPDCVEDDSPFLTQIDAARQAFDAQFNVTTSWKEAGRSVRVTGIGFFDKSHGQIGMAPNAVELHPVLSIVFDPQPVSEGRELIVEGSFEAVESRDGSPTPWSASSDVENANYISTAGKYPRTGNCYAYMGARNASDGVISQTVSIPSDATSAVLRFWVCVQTAESLTDEPFDLLEIEIRNGAGEVLATPLTVSNSDAASSENTPGVYFQPETVDLSEFAGQTVTVAFHATNGEELRTTFRIDDVSLKVSP